MTQNDMNREIARATGESVERIKRLGFRLNIVPRKRQRPQDGGSQCTVGKPKPRPVAPQGQACAA